MRNFDIVTATQGLLFTNYFTFPKLAHNSAVGFGCDGKIMRNIALGHWQMNLYCVFQLTCRLGPRDLQ